MVKGEKTQDWNLGVEIASPAKSLTGIPISELATGCYLLPRPQAPILLISLHACDGDLTVSNHLISAK
jgi:hypothetical protein